MMAPTLPLTSLRFLMVCIVVAVSIPVALVVLWRRASRQSRWALPAILVGVLIGQGAAVAAVAVDVNRDYGFYPSWSSLLPSQYGDRRFAQTCFPVVMVLGGADVARP